MTEKKTANITTVNQKSIEQLDAACTLALTNYRSKRDDAEAKASDLAAAEGALKTAISDYNARVLASQYAGFRAAPSPIVAMFTVGTWARRKYSAKRDEFVSNAVRLDIFDFSVCSEELKNPVCNIANLKTALAALTDAIAARVDAELRQDKDTGVSIAAIVKALQGVMDVFAVPEFEANGKKVKVYARPKDARFLCACATRVSRTLGSVEVLKPEKVAAFVTDVYYTQINHAEYTVKAAK